MFGEIVFVHVFIYVYSYAFTQAPRIVQVIPKIFPAVPGAWLQHKKKKKKKELVSLFMQDSPKGPESTSSKNCMNFDLDGPIQ